MIKIKKKGQEEIVGFVLIMVIVAIVFLIFLGISIRKSSTSVSSESSEIYQFLESSMEYTTECAFSSAPDYYTLGELFEECYLGNNCLNGQDSCEILNKTVNEIMSKSWNINPEGNVKGYEFESIYSVDSSEQSQGIMSLEAGECGGEIRGASYLSPAFPGKIESTLMLCL